MSTTLGLKVDEALRERLTRVADALDRTPHWVMKTALEAFLTGEERRLAEAAEDEARWARYELTGEAVPHTEVKAWLEALARGESAPCPR